ncbi:MAG: HAD hydrolase family protein [Vampirovibrionales bacterium]|nr:HAD hydrolase family protein [Vampirovibrionales bacterium]
MLTASATRFGRFTDWDAKQSSLQAPLVASFDYDGTLQPEVLQVSRVVEGHPKKIAVIVNTGRELHCVKEILPELGQMGRLNALFTSEGSQCYLNTRNLPTREWISSLTPEQADPDWEQVIRDRTKWDEALATRALRSRLNELTSSQLAIGEYNQALSYRDPLSGKSYPLSVLPIRQTPGFVLRSAESDASPALLQAMQRMGKTIVESLAKTLREEGPHAAWSVMTNSPWAIVCKLAPEGVNKGTILDYFLRRHTTSPQRVISAGDNLNDLPALERPQWENTPATALVCGANPDLRRALEGQAHVEFLSRTNETLAEGFRRALDMRETRA